MRKTVVVEDPGAFRLGVLPSGWWVAAIDYVGCTVELWSADEVDPRNPRPFPVGRVS